jgi:medium-chain acyl-[acyl-carrier-protein] hydrolase
MGFLKPGSLLRFAQQLAIDQNTRLGFTNDFYVEHQLAYLLAKQTLAFTRVPRIDEVLTLTTMPEQTRRAVNKRVTIALDAQGEEVACVDSRWVLVDTATRRILRRSSPLFEPYWNEQVDRELPYALPKAEALTELPPRRADYALCDLNGHINNCSYADIACTAVPLEAVRSAPLRRLTIAYHREVPLGQMLALSCGAAADGWYTLGTREDGEPAFEAFCGL